MNGKNFFDSRIYQRYIQQGQITQKDYQTYLKNLPDDSEHAEFIDIIELLSDEKKETAPEEVDSMYSDSEKDHHHGGGEALSSSTEDIVSEDEEENEESEGDDEEEENVSSE